ncbi:MAG: MerR family transcriptional regulator [Clostridiales bacterium]|nr:MerR family transcriptional regulator [Clostridiales bacterium]
MKLKIGEFAAFCDISVPALRLYDRIGLLKPASVDPETGYRYYDPEQIRALNAILSYKKLGFSLQEIKELLSEKLTAAALIQKLCDKQRENSRKSDVCRYHNETIQSILDAYQASGILENDQNAALRLSRIACLENESLEHELSQILWL